MSALLLERSPAFDEGFEREARPRTRLDGAALVGATNAHGRLTLDDLITGAWEGLAVRGTVACPICPSLMAPRSPEYDGDVPTGVCLGCGSSLS
ncbi:MAG TPA: hypothetical protein VNX67_05740 [Solirubrobacteraceae bacterium]|jgi:hypothetical protein|nr:hypothetical protein [Solirubrobacteraceae bacterium]